MIPFYGLFFLKLFDIIIIQIERKRNAKGKKKYIFFLLCIQALLGINGVLYALVMRLVIDEAVKQGRLEDAWEEIRRLKNIIMDVKSIESFQITEEFRTVFGQIPQPEQTENGAKEEPVDPLMMLEGYQAVRNVNMDMVAANIIFANKTYILDYEWNFDFAIPLKYILFKT